MLIGLSVSSCIRDIANGLVNENEVAYIIGGTKFRDDDEFEDACVDHYAKLYWRDNASMAVGIAARLWSEGRIMQPRLLDQPMLVVTGGTWLECKQVYLPASSDDPTRFPKFFNSTMRKEIT